MTTFLFSCKKVDTLEEIAITTFLAKRLVLTYIFEMLPSKFDMIDVLVG